MEKKQELEKRLEDVKGQLGAPPPKKTPKKGDTLVLKTCVAEGKNLLKSLLVVFDQCEVRSVC